MSVPETPVLSACLASLQQKSPVMWQGRVLEATEQTVISQGPKTSIGECCEYVTKAGKRYPGEVIGFQNSHVLTMPVSSLEGLSYGDRVIALGCPPSFPVGSGLIGRVIDAIGQPLDLSGPISSVTMASMQPPVPKPLDRVPIKSPLSTGIKVLDSLLTVGRGQRIGIFGGSGVGKSTLIGMMTRNTAADVIVVGLVGERGREVAEFLEDSLGEEGRRRSVVLVSTSDQSPLLRMRAALAATTVAEYFAACGKHVLLVLDSLTRFAMAAREVGIASGEPPTAKGYTPSVFTKLAKLIERAGQFRVGSITAFYTVLMEGDDQQDPIVDAVRSFVDGHVVLSRELAAQNWYPPVQVLDSVSRLMSAVVTPEHKQHAGMVRRMLSTYARSEDLIRIGAYKKGSDPQLDQAIALQPRIREFLEQQAGERIGFDEIYSQFLVLRSQ